MGGFWPRIYVIKKGHARDIYFLLQTRNFWHFSAPSSLFTCCYLLASAFHRLCLLYINPLHNKKRVALGGCGVAGANAGPPW